MRHRGGLVEIIALLEHIVASMNSRGALPKASFAYLELLRRLELARTGFVACTCVCDEEGERCHFGGARVGEVHSHASLKCRDRLTFLAFPLWCHRAYSTEAGRQCTASFSHQFAPRTSQESRRLSTPPFRALDRRKQCIAVTPSNGVKRVALRLFRERCEPVSAPAACSSVDVGSLLSAIGRHPAHFH